MHFKGTKVDISELSVRPGGVEFLVSFRDDTGVIHGQIQHRIASSELPETAKESLDAAITDLKRWATSIHYAGDLGSVEPGRPPRISGIAETLAADEDLFEQSQ